MPILEALFKRHFWTVHAAGLAAVAFLAAQATTHAAGQYIEGKLAEQADQGKKGRSFAPTSSSEMRNFNDASEQNIFDGKREEPVVAGGPQACRSNAECPEGSVCRDNPDESEDGPEKVCQADTELPAGDVDCTAAPVSSTSMQLVGTAVFEHQEDSLASIIDAGAGRGAEAEIYSINECVEVPEAPEGDVEHENNFLSKPPPCRELPGGHRLVQIGVEDVCIINTEENRYERVTLEEPPKDAPKVASAPKPKTKRKGKSNEFTDEIAEGISKTGPNSYEVKQESVNSALGNLSKLATQARIVPAFEGGEAIGFKLFSIRPGSLYSKIGIQNGDVIQKVNGYDLNSPDKALELYQKLKDGKEFSVDIKRRGKPVTLDYRIAQ